MHRVHNRVFAPMASSYRCIAANYNNDQLFQPARFHESEITDIKWKHL